MIRFILYDYTTYYTYNTLILRIIRGRVLYYVFDISIQGPNPDGFDPNEGSTSEVVDGHGV